MNCTNYTNLTSTYDDFRISLLYNRLTLHKGRCKKFGVIVEIKDCIKLRCNDRKPNSSEMSNIKTEKL